MRRWLLRPLGAFFSIWVAAGCASAPVIPAGPTLEDKLARLMKLEDERSLGDGEVEARLSDPAGRVRGQAALVRARIGGPGAALKITPLLDDASPYVPEQWKHSARTVMPAPPKPSRRRFLPGCRKVESPISGATTCKRRL